MVRYDVILPNMKTLYFRPEQGMYQCVKDDIFDTPNNVKAVIIKFTLSDINIRKSYHTLTLA